MSVSLQKIAQEAGVTRAAVCMALRDNPTISVVRRKEIKEIARRLGYQPNAAARALVKGRSQVIGIICDDLYDPHLYQGIAQAEKLCTKAGYGLQITTIENRPDWLQGLRRQEVDLLISLGLHALWNARLEIPEVFRSKVVMIGPTYFGSKEVKEFPRQWGFQASWDDAEMGKKAAEYLLSLGHRRIGVVAGQRALYGYVPKAAGGIEAIEAAGAKAVIVECEDEADKAGSGREMTEKLLAIDSEITAIFMRNDMFYPGVILALNQAGLKVPKDISVIGCLNLYREVTGMYSPLAQGVSQVLGHYLEQGRLPEKDIVLPLDMNFGRTCAQSKI